MPKGQEDVARAFYGGILGMKEIEKPETLKSRGGVWFSLGARQVHLGVEDNFKPATKAHPAFLVSNLKTLAEVFRAHGFPVIDDELLPGYDRFHSKDPFGNRLEFLKPMNP